MSSIRQNILQQEISQDMMERESEVGIFVLLNQQPSGFIQKGTEKMPEPIELMNPGKKSILTRSAYARPLKGGKKGFERVKIRYLASSTKIHIDEQVDEGAVENPVDDRIEFTNGQIVVAAEGSGVGMLNFMRHDSRNALGKDRIKSVEPVYTEIFPEKEKVEDNEEVFAQAEAVVYINKLIISKTVKGVEYEEDRLNALARLFNVVADTPAGKISGLIANAKIAPADFLKKAKEYEQSIVIDISHAVALGLISLEGTKASYVGTQEIITTYSDKLSTDQKTQKLAAFFTTKEGEHHYKKFVIELNDKKEKNI
jgi:hypothetical protein